MEQRRRFKSVLAAVIGAMFFAGGHRVLAQGDSWARIADMPTPRRLLAAATDGTNLYTFGGCGSPCFGPPFHTSTDEETKVEVYLPQQKKWVEKRRMPTILFGAAAAAPGNGKIYTFGGYISGNVVQEYNLEEDSWKLKAPMPTPRFGLATVALGRKVYVLGGSDGQRPSAALEIYDTDKDTWAAGPSMPTARVFLAAAALDGKIYAIGGSPDSDGKSQTDAVEIYDPATNSWTAGARLPIARQVSAAVGVNGKVYVFGGFIPGSGVQADTFEYDPRANRWVFRTPMPIARDQAPAVLIGSRALVAGGSVDCHCKALSRTDGYDSSTPVPQVTLSITKTDHRDTVCPGDKLSYEITVRNEGPDPLVGATVVDDFPASLSAVTWTCTATAGSSCTKSGQTALRDNELHLLKHGEATYTVGAILTDGAGGTLTNPVRVELPGGVTHLGKPEDLEDQDVDKILGDLGVELTRPRPEPLKPRGLATYTATVTPVSGTMKEVELVTEVMEGAVFRSPLPGGCHPETETRILCVLGDLTGPSSPLVFPLEIQQDCPSPTIVQISATVSTTTSECNSLNNFATAEAAVNPAVADLKLSITEAIPDPVASPAGTITYGLTVENLGPDPACDVTVHQSVTDGKLIGSKDCGPLDGSSVDCPFPTKLKKLEKDATVSFETTFAPCPAEVASTGVVSSATPDPNKQNNQAEVKTGCGIVDLVITKTDQPDPVSIGDELSYTIKVENAGTLDAANVIVKDFPPPPEQLTQLRWCEGKECSPDLPGPVDANVDIPAGTSKAFQMRGTVSPIFGALAQQFPVCGPLLNRVTAEHPADKAEDEEMTHVRGISLFCTLIDGPTLEGSMITYTFALINCGPAAQMDNPGDEFTDTLPASLTLFSASADSGTASALGNTASWNGSVDVGQVVTIKVIATINLGTAGTTICNQATGSFDVDENGTNETIILSGDLDLPGDADPCCFHVPLFDEIPTISEIAALALALLLAALALRRLRLPSAGR